MYKNFPFLKDKISIDKQLTFKRGHDVGDLAQQIFPGGIDVMKVTGNALKAVELTNQLIEQKKEVIYEAAFIFNQVLIYVDILVFADEKYLAYEVKSSLKVSETYLKDAALQFYILKNCLPNFEDLFLVTLNGDYILQEELDLKKLFKRRSIKQNAEKNEIFFEQKINQALLLLEQNAIPNIEIGTHCYKPYQCDFLGTCWKENLNTESIFNLPFIDKNKLMEWYKMGYKKINQLNENLFEKEIHKVIWKSFLNNEIKIDKVAIADFVGDVGKNVAAMDMEIWNPAIPKFNGSKPFDQIPFLFCVFDGRNTNHFFAEENAFETKDFALHLIELTKGYDTILVYDKTMEVSMIVQLQHKNEVLKQELENLKLKLKDVSDIFLNLSYYQPKFKNNFSLKNISALLLPNEINYSNIGSGLEAMNYYSEYVSTENSFEKLELQTKLIDYCATDCVATFLLFQFLKELK